MKTYRMCSWMGYGAAALMATVGAQAADMREAVHHSQGGVTVSSSGACVRTRWDTSQDECAPTPPPVASKPAPRAVIAQAERTIYFGFNQAALTVNAKQVLDSLALKLQSDTQIRQARVVGFADRLGSESYNEKLSQKRAEAVRDYLIARGFARMGSTETRWLGKSAPKAQCAGDLKRGELIDCLGQDRRVEVEIDYLVR